MADAWTVYRTHPTSDEIADVLGQRLTATVGTQNADGSIHLASVIFLHRDHRLYLETSSVTRKARNAQRSATASMLVQGVAATGRLVMVAAEGTARVIDGPEAQRINALLRAKYLRTEVLDAIDRVWGRLDDVAVEVSPQTWRSWTSSVFRDATEAELGVPFDSVWLSTD